MPDERIPPLCALLLKHRILKLVAPYPDVTLGEVTLILRAACATPGASLAYVLASTLRNRHPRADARRAAYERAAAREAAHLDEGAAPPDAADPFERRRLAAAVARLTPKERELLALVVAELNGPELAAALGCGEGAARERKRALLAKLRGFLDPRP